LLDYALLVSLVAIVAILAVIQMGQIVKCRTMVNAMQIGSVIKSSDVGAAQQCCADLGLGITGMLFSPPEGVQISCG
jgi:hypothetical protein